MKSFFERLIYPYLVYDETFSTLFTKNIRTGFIYTMSSNDAWMKQMGYDQPVRFIEQVMGLTFGMSELLIVNDTSQFDDYSKYVATRFDLVAKAKRRAEVFPDDCKKAFEMGVRFSQRQ